MSTTLSIIIRHRDTETMTHTQSMSHPEMSRTMEFADNIPCRTVLKNVKENMFTVKTGISKIIKMIKKKQLEILGWKMKYLKQNKKAEHDDGSSKTIQSKEKKMEKREKPSGPRGIEGLTYVRHNWNLRRGNGAEVLFLEMAENFIHVLLKTF